MRYLWVEDFGGGQNEEALKQKWLKWFQLENKDIIYKHSLVDAVTYINKNRNDFDAVLLDIRFPEQNNSSVKDVYEKYFSNIVTEEFYEEKMKDDGCAAGIIAFMYLIFEERFPRDRIAFLSANISAPQIASVLPKEIESIISMIENREKPDSEIYDFNEENVYGVEIKEFVDNSKGNEYIQYLRSIEYKNINSIQNQDRACKSNSNKSYLAYDEARDAFRNVGIELLHAYPKPESNDIETNCTLTEKFIKKVESKYNVFRRNVISLAEILSENLEHDLIAINSKKYFNSNDDLYDQIYFNNILYEIQNLPLMIPEIKINAKLKQLAWLLTHCIESINAPIFFMPKENTFIHCLNYKKCVRTKYGFKKKIDDRKFICELDHSVPCNSKAKANSCVNTKECIYSKDYKTYDMLCISEIKCEYQYSLFEYGSHSILKLTRNWLAHGKLQSKDFDIEFVTFVIAVGFRFLFNIENLPDYAKEKYINLEKKLLSCDISIDLLKDDKEIEKKLKQYCVNLYNKSTRAGITDNIGQVINEIGSKNSKQQCSNKYIYKAFVHALLPTYLKARKNESAGDYSYGVAKNKEYLTSKDDFEIFIPYAYKKIN